MKWFLIVVGCLAAVQIASSWKRCTTGYRTDYFGPDGKPITPVPGVVIPCSAPYKCVTTDIAVTPTLSCLLDPFPGGL